VWVSDRGHCAADVAIGAGLMLFVWDAHGPVLRGALWGAVRRRLAIGPARPVWLINHFDLFGTRQVWLHLTGPRISHALPFRTPLFLQARFDIHLYVGWAIAFWAIPTMTGGPSVVRRGALQPTWRLPHSSKRRDLVDYFGEQYDKLPPGRFRNSFRAGESGGQGVCLLRIRCI